MGLNRPYGRVSPDAHAPIKKLRALGVSYEVLAEGYGCSVTWIRYIVHDYKKGKHVVEEGSP